jgi:hypothetical protein
VIDLLFFDIPIGIRLEHKRIPFGIFPGYFSAQHHISCLQRDFFVHGGYLVPKETKEVQ